MARPRKDIMARLKPSLRPTETYTGDQYDLFFNDEAVQLLHQPAAHTDGDTMVYFPKADVPVLSILASDLGSLAAPPIALWSIRRG